MKKKVLIFAIPMLLAIVLIISIGFTISARENLNYKTQLADQIFRGSLSQAQSGFRMDYSKMNEDEKINYYMQTSSSLSTAINMINLTSYNNKKNRNDLFDAIYSLYWCMTRSDSRAAILAKEDIIYKYLTQIMLNPDDEKDCKALSKLAGGIYSNHAK